MKGAFRSACIVNTRHGVPADRAASYRVVRTKRPYNQCKRERSGIRDTRLSYFRRMYE